MLNPIAQLFRDQDLGKTALTFVVPITTGILSVYTKISPPSKGSPPLPLPLTLLSLCLGLCALWNGILLRCKFPNAANAVEQLGAGSIFFAFYSVVSESLRRDERKRSLVDWVLSFSKAPEGLGEVGVGGGGGGGDGGGGGGGGGSSKYVMHVV
ncbi:hypothetical protein F0562_033943 [Nyssa sinensis]|uniref:Uncharacterized protein n=1 Tax=Nyssa sinensis TaxID=561372 RepID=A0A5J5AGF8_9ASTE|nr:hypothetical protein F0562_033943 [Nyssa sinensis]